MKDSTFLGETARNSHLVNGHLTSGAGLQIVIDRGHNQVYMLPSCASGSTITPFVSFDGSTWFTVPRDVDDNTYPATSGVNLNCRTFLVPPGCIFKVTSSTVEAGESWLVSTS